MAVEIPPFSPALGVEVRGLDLTRPIAEEDRAALRAALDDHQLLRVRAPETEGRDQVRFAALFGPVLDEGRDGLGYQFVSNVEPGGIIREGALLFHSDLAFTREPVLGLSLQALVLPPDGAQTRFANALRACRGLPTPLKERLADYTARHAFDLTTQCGDTRYRHVDLPEREPRAVHPVLFPHPRTGEPVLYVSEMQTVRILELDERESDALLEELFSHLYAADNIYEHEWREGDLLLWDNVALQHARPVPTAPRTMRRVTLARNGVADLVDGFTAGQQPASHWRQKD